MASAQRKQKSNPENNNPRSYERSSDETQKINKVIPRNSEQKLLLQSINENYITIAEGPPGTGKTLLAVWALYQKLKRREIEKIYIIRLVTETNNENIGALPGDIHEKLNWMTGAVNDALTFFASKQEAQYLLNKDSFIEVLPISHLRGRSLRNVGVLVEEAQNLTLEQIYTAVSRMELDPSGNSSTRFIFTGDDDQSDIPSRCGMYDLKLLLGGIEQCQFIKFNSDQIYRSPILGAIVERYSAIKNKLRTFAEPPPGFAIVPF